MSSWEDEAGRAAGMLGVEGWWRGREEPAGALGGRGEGRRGAAARAWAGPHSGRRVEKASSLSLRGRAPPAVGVGPATRLWCPWQALMDDTEDVSLDFGNEEELAFRKAKVRYVGTGLGRASPKAANSSIHVHSLAHSPTHSLIQNVFSTQCVPGLVQGHTPDRPDKVPALLEPAVWVGGD